MLVFPGFSLTIFLKIWVSAVSICCFQGFKKQRASHSAKRLVILLCSKRKRWYEKFGCFECFENSGSKMGIKKAVADVATARYTSESDMSLKRSILYVLAHVNTAIKYSITNNQ